VAGVATAAALLVLVSTVPAAATGGWVIQPTKNRSGASENQLKGVACASAKACIAVGGSGSISVVGKQRALAEGWNGTAWKIQATPNPKGATESNLFAISCWSAKGCMAVGTYFAKVLKALAERWNGTTWHLTSALTPHGGFYTQLNGVSCTSAHACMAVGVHVAKGIGVPLAERWNGTVWKMVPIAGPPGASSTTLLAVSCSAASRCTAVGDSAVGSSSASVLAYRWNGASWHRQATSGTGQLNGVSCPTSSECVAVGTSGTPGASTALAMKWDGSSWQTLTAIIPTGSTQSLLYAVSCAAGGSCTAVGQYLAPTAVPTLAEQWNGTTWQIQPTPNPASATDSYLASVSCLSASACRAAGAAFFAGPVKRTLVEAES
jgi:hypothetical protein